MPELAPASEPTAVDTGFAAAFTEVASFLGRPNSRTVLFAGVPPEDMVQPSGDTVERLADNVGLSVIMHDRGDLVAGRVAMPAVVCFKDGSAVAMLEDTEQGRVAAAMPRPGEPASTTSLHAVLRRDIAAVFAFSATYRNDSEGDVVGLGVAMERRHWLRRTMAPFWRTYVTVAVAALFINLIALASPLFVMNVYDRVLPNEAIATLWVLAVGVSLALLFDLLLKTARAALIDYAGRRADLRLSSLLFDKVMHATLASRPMSTGEYASRVTQYEFVREFFTSNTVAVLIDTAFVFIFLFVIWLIGGWLVAIPAAAFVISVAIGLVAQYRIGRRVAAAANEAAQRQSLLVESIATIETVKSLRAEAPLLRRWQELTKQSTLTSEQIKAISSTTANMTQFVQQMVTVGIVLFGAYLFREGTVSMGAIIASVMLSGRAVGPLSQIAMTLARFRQALMSLRILDRIMSQPEDRPSSAGFVNRTVQRGDVAFQQVVFTYPGTDNAVINELNFSIRGGERIGIIGRIGSGKTTIGRLMAGLYPPTGGRILVDGIDTRQYHPAELRAAVALAGQASDLFSGTVKENLLLGRPGATDEELLAVARITGVDLMVAAHPRGFDMPVGERGSNLSGGQKQAVTIARLLLSRPRVVFLDEPSGAMDLASERILIDNLSKAIDRSTTLIISTHRYSMLELVDRLIVVDRGKVVADGPKQAVIEAMQRTAPGVQNERRSA
jgi:ATP-binding cassette subfamily C protein LapB